MNHESAPQPGEQGSTPTESPMMERLRAIDRTAVQKLIRIKKEQDLLDKYLKKAESLKAKTNETVYQRVIRDYQERADEFDRQAAPLKGEARKEYQALSSVLDELKKAFEAATVSKEELEFRHAIGELKEKELEQRIQEAKQNLDLRSSELAEAKQVKKEFLAAFNSEDELTAEASPDPRPEPMAVAAPPVPEPEPEPMPEPVPERAPPVVPERPAADLGTLETNIMPVPAELEEAAKRMQLASAPTPSKKEDDTENTRKKEALDSTFIVPVATLLTDGNENPAEFHLGALSYIGRAKDNQIRLSGPGVSRRHAVVSAGPEGFKLKDLESQNGTFVNQKRVSECVLTDGDRVRIGFVELTFRLAQ